MSNAPLLQMTAAGKLYQGHRAFGPVRFCLAAGERVGVAGRSGSGKSTLARCLAGLEPLTEGTRSLAAAPSAVQLVFQDSPSALNPHWTVAELISEPLRLAGVPADGLADRLSAVGLESDLLLRRPGQLSGGQRRRIAIARALAVPNLRALILDEALAGLDPESAAGILALLASLQDRHGISLVHISHDLDRIWEVADRIVIMAAGLIVEELTADKPPAECAHVETRALWDARL